MFSKKKNSIKGKNGEAAVLNNRFLMTFPEEWEDQSIYRFRGAYKDNFNLVYLHLIRNISVTIVFCPTFALC